MQALPPFNPAQAQLMQQMMEQMMPQQEAPKGSPASFASLLANYLEAQIKTTQQFVKELRNAEKQARRFEQEEGKAATGTRKRKKAADPSKPKRPKSGYLLYLQDNLPVLKAEFPEREQKELFTLIAQRWNTIGPKEKEKYLARAAALKEEWTKEKEGLEHSQDSAAAAPSSASASRVAAPAPAAAAQSSSEEEEEEEDQHEEEEEDGSDDAGSSEDEAEHKRHKHRSSEEDTPKKKHKKHKKNRDDKEKKKKKKHKDKRKSDASAL